MQISEIDKKIIDFSRKSHKGIRKLYNKPVPDCVEICSEINSDTKRNVSGLQYGYTKFF